MKKDMNIVSIFKDKQIRKTVYNGEWYFVIKDVVSALTDTKDTKSYIKRIRRKDDHLSKRWKEIVVPFTMQTKGGKQPINCANIKGIYIIIQAIPSKKAKSLKRWLSGVGEEDWVK